MTKDEKPIEFKRENVDIEIDGEQYYIPGKTAIDAANLLTYAWDEAGKPDTLFSDGGDKIMTVLVSMWQDLYPEESKQWMEDRKEYQDNELESSEQIRKETGRSLASVPMFFHTTLKALFKDEEMDREYYKKLVKKYPMFRMTNKV